MESLAPIILFTFKRPEHTAKVLEALAVCPEAKESELIVYSDGMRSEGDRWAVAETRKIIRDAKGFKSIKSIEREENMGLAASVIEGVQDVMNSHGRAIVLEDDLVVDPQFLQYMNHFLNKYEDREEVISIHGYVYPLDVESDTSYFIRGADCWGWATWRRGWDLFEADAEKLYGQLKEDKGLSKRFEFGGSYPYMKMLEDQIDGKIDSWAIRWYASAFLQEKLTLYPARSLVQNIGMDGSGTHADDRTDFNSEDAKHKNSNVMKGPLNIEEDVLMVDSFSEFFRSVTPTLYKRLIKRILP